MKGNTWITFCAIFFFSFPMAYYASIKNSTSEYVQESESNA